jgi:hypothetical protein
VVESSQQRPFVPTATPTRAQPPVAIADFAISRPFVPGADREHIVSLRPSYEEKGVESTTAFPPIEAFLDRSPRAYADAFEASDDEPLERAGVDDELPPVEHFTDPLPAVQDFASADALEPTSGEFGFEPSAAADEDPVIASEEWGETDWQQYDWRAAAALGESGDTEASNAWATTDWDANAPSTRSGRPTPAQAIAKALDEIAQQIREGDLPVGGTPRDPGSLAASLAALFGIKR